MNRQTFKSLAAQHHVDQVKFIESGCSPLVIEFSFEEAGQRKTTLLKTDNGDVIALKNISQAYEICRDAGIHKAYLVQVIPHDEACTASFLSYDQQSMPLTF